MIKKISAIVLALVLCLSVVVVPVSAVELGSAKQAFEVKFDKEYYSAGDTAVVSVYAKVAEGYEIGASYIVIGLNSAVFPQAENTTANIKSSLATNGVGSTHFKDPATYSTVAWAPTAQVNAIKGANTADENALYDQYIKVSLNKNTDDGTGTKNGFPSEELNADEDPILTLELKVAAGLADGTAVNAAVTTGAISKGLAYMAYYSNPGNATSTSKFTVADSTTVAASATIGAATAPSILKALNGQMRYANEAKTAFDVRALAYISGAEFTATFGDIPTAKSMITKAGFVFAAGSNVGETIDSAIVEDIVKNYADGTGRDGFLKKEVTNISTSISDGNYVLSCMVPGVTEAADYNNSLIAVAYIIYEDANGEPQYIYYDAAQVIEFAPLFDAKV